MKYNSKLIIQSKPNFFVSNVNIKTNIEGSNIIEVFPKTCIFCRKIGFITTMYQFRLPSKNRNEKITHLLDCQEQYFQ
jgi:hypothetical protein